MTNFKLRMTFTILTLARCHNDEDDVPIIYQITLNTQSFWTVLMDDNLSMEIIILYTFKHIKWCQNMGKYMEILRPEIQLWSNLKLRLLCTSCVQSSQILSLESNKQFQEALQGQSWTQHHDLYWEPLWNHMQC